MSLSLGNDFAKRWQTTPATVRQAIYAELQQINDLLDSDLSFNDWFAQQHNNESSPTLLAEKITELKQQFWQEADVLIEEALTPIKAQLKTWLSEKLATLDI